MKKKILSLFFVLLFLLLMLTACSLPLTIQQEVARFAVDEQLSEAMLEPVLPAATDSVTRAIFMDGTSIPAPVRELTTVPVTAAAPAAAQPEGEDASSEADGQTEIADAPAGALTAKGYHIEQVDGITYVDGVLIANKTYSLPEDYDPGALMPEAAEAFAVMQNAAEAEGIHLFVMSGYRSYSLQTELYSRYVIEEGQDEADRYSARPGHSEHQSGLAMDLNDINYSFADTPEGQWVAAHCYEYGFILRYPQEKEEQTGYRYEPWHVRYLGVDLATKVYESGLCLEEYFGITSTYQ